MSGEDTSHGVDVEVIQWNLKDLEVFKQNVVSSESIENFVMGEVIKKQNKKHVNLLSMSAEERYLELLATTPIVIQQVSIKILASYLGITPESLSRIRKSIR